MNLQAMRGAVLAGALVTGFASHAQEPETPVAVGAKASSAPTAVSHAWEGALGLNTSYRPEYAGASRQVLKLTPALFLRYGRFTITNASGFVTRRADDVVRGLGIDLLRSDRVHMSLALRFDAGRSEGTSQALQGLGDIQPTVRARAAASWKLDGPWRLGASWSVDAFGRGGGNFGDVSAGWDHRLNADTTLSLGTALALAGDRYMQTYYGISAEQAARTGYAAYTPSAGLRDVSLFANVRHEFNPEWTLLGGASTTRLLGPAAASPLTQSRSNWGLNLGLARRF